MDFSQAVAHYLPYWILAITMVICTLRSEHKEVMRFQLPSFLKFAGIMVRITLFRALFMFVFPPSLASAGAVLKIPLWLTLFTPWEDACFLLPLVIASRMLGESKLAKAVMWGLTGLTMVSFGIGHLYQSLFAACMISMMIPIGTGLAKKHGIGTTMASHILYDFLTISIIRIFLGV